MKDLIQQIQELKSRRKAIILAHNYQIPEVQDIADFLGDSLELSRQAAKTSAEIVVFCGVHFMAETAAILSPEKTVLLPDINAGCPLANIITPGDIRNLRQQYPKIPIVAYVNTSASVKAETDIACTSANALKVISALLDEEIIFIPDKYLSQYAASKTNKKIHFWNGYCPAHLKILPEDIERLKKQYPKAKVMVHPECREDVIALADAVFSTSGMLRYAKEIPAEVFIVGTEPGLIHRLSKEIPQKKFIPASELAICPDMKLINLEKILWSLEELKYEVKVPEETRQKALKSVNRMIELV
ncbi:MAG: quinolinate synthase NadA [Elusimicrobiota bacterium]|nr:quinolinate synthase NadA [Elusimicrobiota bacterium]